MKRQKPSKVKSTWSIFHWRECSVCHNEFRREKLWYKYIFRNMFTNIDYICTGCAPDLASAEKVFNDQSVKVTPPPPNRRSGISSGNKPQSPPITIIKENTDKDLNFIIIAGNGVKFSNLSRYVYRDKYAASDTDYTLIYEGSNAYNFFLR